MPRSRRNTRNTRNTRNEQAATGTGFKAKALNFVSDRRVQVIGATAALTTVGLLTGNADITPIHALTTTGISALMVGATALAVKGAQKVYENATMENVKAVPTAMYNGASTGLGYVFGGLKKGASYIPGLNRFVAPAQAEEEVIDEPKPRARSRRRNK